MLPAGLFQGALGTALVLLFLSANQLLPLSACAVPWLPLLKSFNVLMLPQEGYGQQGVVPEARCKASGAAHVLSRSSPAPLRTCVRGDDYIALSHFSAGS